MGTCVSGRAASREWYLSRANHLDGRHTFEFTRSRSVDVRPRPQLYAPELLGEELLHRDRPLVERLGILPARDRDDLLLLLFGL